MWEKAKRRSFSADTDGRSVCTATSATSRSGFGRHLRGLGNDASASNFEDGSESGRGAVPGAPILLLPLVPEQNVSGGEPSRLAREEMAPLREYFPSTPRATRGEIGGFDASASPALVGRHHRPPETVEGRIYYRKGRSGGRGDGWRRGYAILDLAKSGTINCYKNSYVKKLRRADRSGDPDKPLEIDAEADQNLLFCIPGNISWTAKDIQNSVSSFIIEIQSNTPRASMRDINKAFTFKSTALAGVREDAEASDNSSDEYLAGSDSDGDNADNADKSGSLISPNDGLSETFRTSLRHASELGKPFRIYIKCSRRRNDKAQWLAAFSRLKRLSQEIRPKRRINRILHAPSLMLSRSRMRNPASILFHSLDDPRFPLNAEKFKSLTLTNRDPNLKSSRPRGWGTEKEYKVYPAYAYPHQWMTNEELHAEMIKPSEKFHDLRVPSAQSMEIGSLKVEVLRCVGLPKLDRGTGTDAVAYLVCGSHAFTTDTIWNRMSPMWLSKTRRACIFPIFHAYARLFVGIFDDGGKNEKENFAGRIVLDIARCRPGSVYDVTLPLRTSAHVYTRRARGAVRLRFSVNWNSERSALLSYIPKNIRLRSKQRPDEDVTILCADEKSFRNIALTVHGSHMPGRFSSHHFKSTMREINFNRKLMIMLFRQFLKDTRQWKEPPVSSFIFLTWMHCLYMNAFYLVPAYFVFFLFLMLMRNYYVFGAPGALHNGFAPPSWPEMFRALVLPRKSQEIEPLQLPALDSTAEARLLTANEIGLDVEPPTEQENGPITSAENPSCDQLEFPFSRGLHYPKLTVKESVVVSMNSKKKKKILQLLRKDSDDNDENDNDDGYDLIPEARNTERHLVPFDFSFLFRGIKMVLIGKGADDNGEANGDASQGSGGDVNRESNRFQSASSMLSISRWMQKGQGDGFGETGTEIQSLNDDNSHEDRQLIVAPVSVATADTAPCYTGTVPIPDQNMDVVVARRRKMTDDLREMRDNFHRFTGYLFDDRTHVIKNASAHYFGQKKRTEGKRRKKRTDVSQEIERLLKVGSYSTSNPIMSRLGVYVEPMISSALSFLCLNRALYNVATWMDPMLTFLVSFALLCSSLILFIFPWRIFLFVLGFIVVGPQNWIFRILKERRKDADNKNNDGSDSEEESSSTNDDDDLPLHQPIINSNTGSNGATAQQLKREDIDTRGIHRVCVPYSQLRYQRFYDWPPERQYASVEKEE